MTFSDPLDKHTKGVAMMMSPAPPIAHLCVDIFEEENVKGTFEECIDTSHQYIIGYIVLWDQHDPDPAIGEANWTV